ncbi:MAG: AI-2E family transporter [Hamadaea sp.]|nr:AI-2E family transporter [Hamadaea sp.]NUT06671.1 AI-2E family transporter [Hamadaea sp.]
MAEPDPAGRSLADRVPPSLVFRWAVAGAAGVVAVAAVVLGLYTVRNILVLVLIALFVAVSLDPAVRWMVRRGLHRSWAVSIVILVLVALFGLFVWSIVPPVVDQSGTLLQKLPSYVQTWSEKSRAIQEITDRYNLTDRLTSLAGELPGRIANGALGFVQKLFGTIAAALTVLVLSIYFMADMPRLQRGVVRLFPPAHRRRGAHIVAVVVDKVGGYMIGNIVISLIAGVAAFICFQAVGVPYAVPLAVMVAITDLIPMIGASLGAIIGVGVSLLTVGIWPRSIVVLLFFIAYQQIENYLIQPRVMRNAVDLSPVAVLVVALIGGTVLGLVGALMAIPIAAAVKVVLTPMVVADDPADAGDGEDPGTGGTEPAAA